MSSKLSIALFIVKLFGDILALVELPQVDKNNILETDLSIRETTNKLFSTLKLQVNERPALKQYSLIHNYLVSTSLQDYTNLIEIAKLTRVDKIKLNHQTKHFMAIINEILNEDIKHETNIKDGYVIKHIAGFLKNLDEYTDKYKYNENNVDFIVTELLKLLESNVTFAEELSQDNLNTTNSWLDSSNENNTEINENKFWVPNGRRIFSGTKASIKDFPFVASLQIFNHFQCAGSIIKSDLIITAASCLQLAWNNRFFRENPAFLSARVGSTYHNVGGEIIPIMEVYFHPSYDPRSLNNNLALARLHRTLKFSKRITRVKKIEIDHHDHALPSNTRGITIVGWGARTRSNIVDNPHLSYAVLDFYMFKDCQDVYSKTYVTKKNFCAGFISAGSGACNRDIGGPGIARGILVGVVSFGSPVCGTPDAPTVFTKLGFYAHWIDGIMKQNVPRGHIKTTLFSTRIMTIPYSRETETPLIIKPIIFTKKPNNVLRLSHDKQNVSLNTFVESKEYNILREVTIKGTKTHKYDKDDDISETTSLIYVPITTLEPPELPSTQMINIQEEVLEENEKPLVKELFNTLISSTEDENLLKETEKNTKLNMPDDQQKNSIEDYQDMIQEPVEHSSNDKRVLKTDDTAHTYEIISLEFKDDNNNKLANQEIKDRELNAKLEHDITSILDDINLEEYLIKEEKTTTEIMRESLTTQDDNDKLKDIFTFYLSDYEQKDIEDYLSGETKNSPEREWEINSGVLKNNSFFKDNNEEILNSDQVLFQVVTDVLREELIKRFKDIHQSEATAKDYEEDLKKKLYDGGNTTVVREKITKSENMRVLNNIRITKTFRTEYSQTLSKLSKKSDQNSQTRKSTVNYRNGKSY